MPAHPDPEDLPIHLANRLMGAPLDAIKLLAAVLMLGDHVNTILLDGHAPLLWWLGRIAFPLFAFVVALHLARGRPAGPYAAGLLLVGVPTQVVYAAAFPYGTTEANILFTLAGGAVLAGWLAQAGPWRHLALGVGLAVALGLPGLAKTGVDFGLVGLLLPGALLLVLNGAPGGRPWLVAVVAALNAIGWHPRGVPPALDAALCASAILVGLPLAALAATRFAGQPRVLSRFALQAFYPAHLAVLATLRALGLGLA